MSTHKRPHSLPKIGITMGDPTGIGPEIIVKALSKSSLFRVCRPVIFGDQGILLKAIHRFAPRATLEIFGEPPEEGYSPRRIFLLPVSQLAPSSLRFGKLDRACGQAMVKYIEEAVRCATDGKLDGMTTCPIHKQAIREAGYSFSGHTELLAHLTKASLVAMMFAGSKWKVVLVTTHLPLCEVPRRITKERVFSIIRLTGEGLKKYFGIRRPKIAVLGLNPHAGEEGLLGKEEERAIFPAIEKGRSQGVRVDGPFPADSFFNMPDASLFDAVVAMYHDQGLIPIKMFDFRRAVNLTLGLPFVRTSVGHGTAYDIAGKGLADPSNLTNAITLASNLSKFIKKY
ncbi:MAG: 4-hydroxythreonine-4-phosphate dehydrogenase PdxA [Thermodesulfobacteriota bacterium]